MKERYLARSRAVAARQIGDEWIIMSARDSTLFSLNPIAALIWQAADGQTPLATIVKDRICSDYDVEPEEALRDAEELVAGLAAHGVLLIAESPMPPSSDARIGTP